MNKSRQLDQFYTKQSVAIDCFEFLKSTLKDFEEENYFYVEPSAGTGSFYNILPNNKIGFDIDPKLDGIIKKDFFEVNDNIFKEYKNIITIGNPPFGKNSSLAVKFFNKSCEYSNIVAMILPKTFRKNSIIKRLNICFHLLAELELQKDSFEFENKSYDVPCVFQIWVKQDKERIIKEYNITQNDFEFVEKNNADFAIRRVGVLAGKVIEDYKNYSENSHYYIKCLKDKNIIINNFKNINWDAVKYNTAGNPSISKKEIVEQYVKNKVL